MPKFIIVWDAGYGKEAEVVECADQEQANKAAYEAWRDAAENAADYNATPYTKELAEELEIGE